MDLTATQENTDRFIGWGALVLPVFILIATVYSGHLAESNTAQHDLFYELIPVYAANGSYLFIAALFSSALSIFCGFKALSAKSMKAQIVASGLMVAAVLSAVWYLLSLM